VTELDYFVEKHASVLATLRTAGVVRSVDVQRRCLFVHAEAGSERIRAGPMRAIKTKSLTDLEVFITVNPALPLAEANGELATGVGTVGTMGGALDIGQKQATVSGDIWTELGSLSTQQHALTV
jgi:hypothetical protein